MPYFDWILIQKKDQEHAIEVAKRMKPHVILEMNRVICSAVQKGVPFCVASKWLHKVASISGEVRGGCGS